MARKKPVIKECTSCGDRLKANTDNFHLAPNGKDGLKAKCKKCSNKENREKYEIERKKKLESAKLKEISERHKRETKEMVDNINSRNHRPIPIGKPCVLVRLAGRENTNFKGKRVKGKFIKVYPSLLMFETEDGVRECFRKNDLGVEWLVEKRA